MSYPVLSSYSVVPHPNGTDYRIYSPDIFEQTMYLGGWLTPGDVGPDKLYASPAGQDAPAELVWNAASPYGSYHVNDPFVVRGKGELLLLATASPNDAPSPTGYNQVGLAVSTDNGASWTWKGVVIGQNNGIDDSGAWSPTAVVTSAGIDVWYNTGAIEADTGQPVPSRVFMTQVDADGKSLESTTACIDTSTGAALSAGNVDVKQMADGSYWMVGNGTGYLAFVAYRSQDGIHWTPWSGTSDPVLIPANGATQFAPTIESVDSSSITILWSDLTGGMSGSGSVERSGTIQFNNPPQANFTVSETNYTRIDDLLVTGDADYIGGTDYLKHDLIDMTPANVIIQASTPDCFIVSGSGMDALVGLSGHNILDGEGGSNILEGGSGIDTFFVTAGGDSTWNEIINFRPGDDITFWNVVPGAPLVWVPDQGVPGYLGATTTVVDTFGVSSNLTLAGFSVDQAQALSNDFGVAGAGPYMHVSL